MTESGHVIDSTVPTLIIRPPRKWVPVDLHELWNYRELFTSFTRSMVANANIMTKVYFPRLIMPISGMLSLLVDFAVSILILVLKILSRITATTEGTVELHGRVGSLLEVGTGYP